MDRVERRRRQRGAQGAICFWALQATGPTSGAFKQNCKPKRHPVVSGPVSPVPRMPTPSLTYQPLFTHNPLYTTGRLREAMQSFHQVWGERHQSEQTLKLYHYTTLAGLEGILRTRSLHFGHSSTMNDPQELHWGKRIVDRLLESYEEDENDEGAQGFLRAMRMNVSALGVSHNVYLACFCEAPNLLSQWRAYTGSGGGYSLEFSFTDSTQLAFYEDGQLELRPPFLRRVVYDPDDQESLVRQYVERVLPVFKTTRIPASERGQASHVLGLDAAQALIEMVLCFKHEAFREEMEWRAVRVVLDNHRPDLIEFRRKGDEVFPYRPMLLLDTHPNQEVARRLGQQDGDAGLFPLTGVQCGPSHAEDRVLPAVNALVHSTASDVHPVRIVPHRVALSHAGFYLR